MTTIQLSLFAEKMLTALRRLSAECEPHPCGGFTTDDIEWRLGTAFTSMQILQDSIQELSSAGLIRYAGYDDDDAVGHCYEAVT